MLERMLIKVCSGKRSIHMLYEWMLMMILWFCSCLGALEAVLQGWQTVVLGRRQNGTSWNIAETALLCHTVGRLSLVCEMYLGRHLQRPYQAFSIIKVSLKRKQTHFGLWKEPQQLMQRRILCSHGPEGQIGHWVLKWLSKASTSGLELRAALFDTIELGNLGYV